LPLIALLFSFLLSLLALIHGLTTQRTPFTAHQVDGWNALRVV
jgi:hypothetical protein